MEKKNNGRQQLRRMILHNRDRLPEAVLCRKSMAIACSILALEEIRRSRVIFVYMHFRSEVRTSELIESLLSAGHIVTVPVTRQKAAMLAVRITDSKSYINPGPYGIPEPDAGLVEKQTWDPARIDAAIVPGSVFDRTGGRLGYGGGYYDRFLAEQATSALRIGAAFEDQLVEMVPTLPHDQFMDYVVSEKQVYRCGRNSHAQNSRLQE
jgi:5-formyltetrahydrofolate cyclo-ligase